ncbi:MAG: hypothetical protein RIM99_18765 [Cyclobacteriaceae bacterium]
MKTRYLFYILGTVLVFFTLFLFNKDNVVDQHPSLSVEAERPDIYLRNAAHYAFEHDYDRSLYHLDKAIEAIRKIESDVDLQSVELLDGAISRLQNVREKFIADSTMTGDMYSEFEFSLNALAHAELRVSEMYAETNHREFATMALKHARLHLKNAIWFGDESFQQVENNVFLEIDSLIQNDALSPVELTSKIDRIIIELDKLLEN